MPPRRNHSPAPLEDRTIRILSKIERERERQKERRAILTTPNQPQILEFHSLHMKQNRNKASQPISHSGFNLSLRISPTAAGSSKLHGGTNLHCVHTDLLLCNHGPWGTHQPGSDQCTRPLPLCISFTVLFTDGDQCIHLQTRVDSVMIYQTLQYITPKQTCLRCRFRQYFYIFCNCDMIFWPYRSQFAAHSTAVKACKSSCCPGMVHVQSSSSSSVCLGSAFRDLTEEVPTTWPYQPVRVLLSSMLILTWKNPRWLKCYNYCHLFFRKDPQTDFVKA